MNNYSECTVDGCDNLTTKQGLCHFHKSIIQHKSCSNIYFKNSIEWCDEHSDRANSLDCESCDDWLDPIENMQLCEKMWRKGL